MLYLKYNKLNEGMLDNNWKMDDEIILFCKCVNIIYCYVRRVNNNTFFIYNVNI